MQLDAPFRVVTSAVDGEILAVLAHADAEFTVTQLRSAIGRSTEGIRRAVERLTDQGVVLRRSIGRTTSYRLNREHIAAPSIVALAELPVALRDRIITLMKSWSSPPRYSALFGSAARQPMRTDSDIDIFLVADDVDSPDWNEQVAILARSITDWTGNDTRPLIYLTDDARGKYRTEAVLRDVLTDGVPLVGDHAAFRKLVRG